MADRPKGYRTRATTILAVLIVTGVISSFGIASSSASTLRASASGNLRACGSFAERHGSNIVQIFEHNVTCRNGREFGRDLGAPARTPTGARRRAECQGARRSLLRAVWRSLSDRRVHVPLCGRGAGR